jgi:hypothetical protein
MSKILKNKELSCLSETPSSALYLSAFIAAMPSTYQKHIHKLPAYNIQSETGHITRHILYATRSHGKYNRERRSKSTLSLVYFTIVF